MSCAGGPGDCGCFQPPLARNTIEFSYAHFLFGWTGFLEVDYSNNVVNFPEGCDYGGTLYGRYLVWTSTTTYAGSNDGVAFSNSVTTVRTVNKWRGTVSQETSYVNPPAGWPTLSDPLASWVYVSSDAPSCSETSAVRTDHYHSDRNPENTCDVTRTDTLSSPYSIEDWKADGMALYGTYSFEQMVEIAEDGAWNYWMVSYDESGGVQCEANGGPGAFGTGLDDRFIDAAITYVWMMSYDLSSRWCWSGMQSVRPIGYAEIQRDTLVAGSTMRDVIIPIADVCASEGTPTCAPVVIPLEDHIGVKVEEGGKEQILTGTC